jgi:hypothetical protein
MKKIPPFIKVWAIGIGLLVCRCSVSQLAGGNSSQTGNNGIIITAQAQSISGTTAPDAHLALYDQNFRPYLTPSGFCDSTIADKNGYFALSPGRGGYYNLLVCDVHRGSAAFVQRIPVFADSTFTYTLDTLRQPGFISGTAIDTTEKIYPLSYVYIDGSPFYTVTKNNGDFQLGPLPVGTYTTGFFANFQVADIPYGAISQMTIVKTDKSMVTVFPDSVSVWHW